MPTALGQIEQALTYVSPEIDDTEFEDKDWYNKFVPMDSRRMPGVQQIEYYRITRTGRWTLLGDYANIVESTNVYAQKITYDAATFGQKVEYSRQEKQAIEFAGSNGLQIAIDTIKEKLTANKESWVELVDRILSRGQLGKRTYGMLTHPDVPRYAAPTRITQVSDPDDDVQMLFAMVNSIPNSTKGKERPNTAIFDAVTYQILSQKKYSDDAKVTVMDYFLKNNGMVSSVDMSYDMVGAGPNNGDLALIYNRDPRKVVGIIPEDRTQVGQPQDTDYRTEIYFAGQVAGVHYRRPFSARIIEFPAA